jgi:hypothetical protein
MWKSYFGSRCKIYGVDIQPACTCYADESTKIFIGDQSSREFWKTFKEQVSALDVVIDDGSHLPRHQMIALEELLPHLQPGGVYICEDVHSAFNDFASYVSGIAHGLNAYVAADNVDSNERRLVGKVHPLQAAINSVHSYPFVSVIEKRDRPLSEFLAPKHGDQWAPFLK